MNYKLTFHFVLLIILISSFSCTKEPNINMKDKIIVKKIDSFIYLTPCLVDIVTDYENYVRKDTLPHNDDYHLTRILRLQVDSMKYYWLTTDREDETEYILTEQCDVFCTHNGWTGYNEKCLTPFKDSIWTVVWQK